MENARKAIIKLNGLSAGGSKLRVSFAKFNQNLISNSKPREENVEWQDRTFRTGQKKAHKIPEHKNSLRNGRSFAEVVKNSRLRYTRKDRNSLAFESTPWEKDTKEVCHRINTQPIKGTWFACTGIPLRCWSRKTLEKVKWGKVLEMEMGSSFNRAMILIELTVGTDRNKEFLTSIVECEEMEYHVKLTPITKMTQSASGEENQFSANLKSLIYVEEMVSRRRTTETTSVMEEGEKPGQHRSNGAMTIQLLEGRHTRKGGETKSQGKAEESDDRTRRNIEEHVADKD